MHRYLGSIFNESEIQTAIQDAFKFNYYNCDLYKEYCDSINKNYSEERQKIRKAIRAEDEKTKKMGGVIDWNYMLNDMM